MPFFLVRFITTRRFRLGLGERLTLYRKNLSSLRSSRSIWLQAASVGEVTAVIPLIRLLRKEYPSRRVVLTCQTAAGRDLGREKFDSDIPVLLSPLDFSPLITRFINRFSPSILILVETEIWPGLILTSRRKGIPVVIVNGRISDGSFGAYRKARPLLRPLFKRIAGFNMRSEKDAERIKALGAFEEKIAVTGNIKFDSIPEAISPELDQEISLLLNRGKKTRIIIGGSTFEGEEEILYRVLLNLLSDFPELLLILAPRHLERIPRLREFFRRKNEDIHLYSRLKAGEKRERRVILVDRMGALFSLYSQASAVFIGRSLRGEGGQNPIEPASLGKPVLFGPRMDNFRKIARDLLKAGGAVEVRSGNDLKEKLSRILSTPASAGIIGEKAKAVVSSRKGASRRNLKAISRILAEQSED